MSLDRKKLQKFQIRDALIYWIYIPAAVIGLGVLADRLFSLSPFPPSILLVTGGAILILVGVLLIWRATEDFKRFGRGTPNPKAPPRTLVTRGAYGLCRHPMFLGYDLTALGVVILFRSPTMLLVSWPLLIVLQIPFLRREEKRVLHKRYGRDFETYRRNVPFLLPGVSRRKR